MALPKYSAFFEPVVKAIKNLGGSASLAEIDEEVIKILSLSDEDVAAPHDARRTELEYRLAWARTYLKLYGLITNSERGIWVLTPKGKETTQIDQAAIRRYVHSLSKKKNGKQETAEPPEMTETENLPNASLETALSQNWRDDLLDKLLKLEPDAFERLCQRLLRESGFVEVKVTGRSGDGGIDGVGVVRLGGLLGFPVLFQCKRYKGSVSASEMRDFRGAMIGRTDRGLFITTGTFSRGAKNEATRDGAPPIDLVDGELLLDKLKELKLGVNIKMVEEVSVVPEFFQDI